MCHFQEVVKYKEWCDAINEEIKVMKRNETWESIDLSNDKQVVGLK